MTARSITAQGFGTSIRQSLPAPTFFAPAVQRLSVLLRWTLIALAPLTYFSDPQAGGGTLIIAGAALVFNLTLIRLDQGARYPNLLLVAAIDCLLIGAGLLVRGSRSDIYLLFTLVLVYLSTAYAWRGALIGLEMALSTYGATLLVNYGLTGEPLTYDLAGLALLRGVYFGLMALSLGLVVRYYHRDHETAAQVRTRLAAQSIQLRSVQHSTQQVVAEHTAETISLRHAERLTTLADQLTTEVLMALAAAIDAKDGYTCGHSKRVAVLAGEMARRLGCPETDVEQIVAAARMHDIGKIGVPDHILHKRGPLTDEERAIIALHPGMGADILAPIHTLGSVVSSVRHHHERFDGAGYPSGLSGEAIPFGARVLAVADALDTMITDRSYRRGMDLLLALEELERHSGTQFDPRIARCAIDLYTPGGDGVALRQLIHPITVPAIPPIATPDEALLPEFTDALQLTATQQERM